MAPYTAGLAVRKSRLEGLGVFAERDIADGEVVCRFSGDVIDLSEMPANYNEVPDHYMQIGERSFLGPSGGIDDYFNHSCEPNAGLQFAGSEVLLHAIRRISAGEEITWDYSTTMDDPDSWTMRCHCRAKYCRGVIGNFSMLPAATRHRYLVLNIVPQFLIKHADGQRSVID